MTRRTLLVLLAACFGPTSPRTLRAAEPFPNERSPLGINLSGVSYSSTEFPFVDVFKASKPFIFQRKGSRYGVGDRHDLRDDGYPKQIHPEHFAEALVLVTDGHYPGGDYVCLYDGRGRLEFAGDARIAKEEAGRVLLRVTPRTQIAVRIVETDLADPLRNIRLLRTQFETTYQRDPFDPDFLRRWAEMRTLRFMDWQRTNGSPQREWADRAKTQNVTWDTPAGVPVEVMVDLANRLHADPWFCIPHQASDDYVRKFAELVRERLDRTLVVHVEYSNECWNTAFPQARYCGDKGRLASLAQDRFEAQLRFYTKRAVEILGLWERVFGKDAKSRLVRVLASQAANPAVTERILQVPDAAGHADALAIAPYFGHSFGDATRADATIQLTPEQIIERLQEELTKTYEQTTRQARLAKDHRLRLLAYEGGQHLVGTGGGENNEALTNLLIAVNRHPKMRQLYLKDLANWRRAGGEVFCLYASVAKPSKWGSWGLLEHADQDPATAPKYRAANEFIAETRR